MSEASEPVAYLPQDRGRVPAPEAGLCLSGGGYRAMLYHLGVLLRLYEVGLLQRMARISSVSGGSITAAVLALAWNDIGSRDDLVRLVVDPVRRLADRTIDGPAIIAGALLPGTIAARVADAYDRHLFGGRTLQHLPDAPKFIINATNLESGALFRFTKAHARDWKIGSIERPTFRVADAVAASSAFPPVLSPFLLDVEPADFSRIVGGVGPEFLSEISLTDGGVYDNLGLETVWKNCTTVFVADGGGKLTPDPSPPGDWGRQAKRVLDVIDQQVRNLRIQQAIASFRQKTRRGAYFGIHTPIARYGLTSALPADPARTQALAETPTRLKRIDPGVQMALINWGYAACDASLRAHYDPGFPAPDGFPYACGI
ncbi:MAG: patatin-like phospholipase family protein [Rhizorhabdus sp.]